VKDGKPLPDQITEAHIQDEKFLRPVLPDDALIMCLDDLPSCSDAAEGQGQGKAPEDAVAPGDAAGKNAALQAQLDELNKQFANYRLAVEQTLDKRWHADDDDSSSRSSAGSRTEKKDESAYYWESYAHHGMLLFHLGKAQQKLNF
jgi:type I protein arginine methyltransferase